MNVIEISDSEFKAHTIGMHKALLRKRLMEAKKVLAVQGLPFTFKQNKFQYPHKRILSDCTHWALQWKVRPFPDRPESYENQQTSTGIVEIVRVW
jgi:hypothetical protein